MTIGILSWRYHETLIRTLESYEKFGLTALDQDRLIFFQEITRTDMDIARKYGWRYVGNLDNIGIAAGYRALAERAGELFLFLENDWKLLEPASAAIVDGRFLLGTGMADIIRYRHRDNPGAPLWTRQFQGREHERPSHLLDSVHWTDPSLFDYGITKEWLYKRPWFIAPSKYANWTNNPHMAYTSFIVDNVLPHMGDGDIERDLQSWWEQQDFKVAQGTGLFTHERTN